MADPVALRVRRSRAHHAGDHSLCRPGRCDQAAAVLAEEAEEIEQSDVLCLDWLLLPEPAEQSDALDRLRARRQARRAGLGLEV